jgi:hypothetical protein
MAGVAHGATETQTFSSDPAPAGWTGQNNNDIGSGGIFGWDAANGRAGGLFSRANGVASYYADTTIVPAGEPGYHVGTRLHAEGDVFFDSSGGADVQVFVAFMDATLEDSANGDRLVGFRMDPGVGNHTIRAVAFGGDFGGYDAGGGNAMAPGSATLPDGAYNFSFDYVPDPLGIGAPVPTPGEITLTLTPSAGGDPVVLRNALAGGQDRAGRPLNAFGFTHNNGSNNGDSRANTYFIDNLTYTGDGATFLAADFNSDGRVDVADLGILATNFNDSPPDPAGRAGGDANLDGMVDVADLGILATLFNQGTGAALSFEQALGAHPNLAAAVPEPAGGLALAGLLAAGRRRRR